MHGKGTTVHCLHMDKLVVENPILSWVMMPTEVNFLITCICARYFLNFANFANCIYDYCYHITPYYPLCFKMLFDNAWQGYNCSLFAYSDCISGGH